MAPTAPTRDHKISKVLQLLFSISPTGRAQGNVSRREKIPKLGMEKQHCRSAVRSGGQDLLLGHTSGLRRMQEQTNTSQQCLKLSCSLGSTVSPRWGKTFISIHDPGVSPLSFHGQLQPWHQLGGCDGDLHCALLSWSLSSF